MPKKLLKKFKYLKFCLNLGFGGQPVVPPNISAGQLGGR